MAKREDFLKQFNKLLGTLPQSSFADWQYAYQRVVYTMAVEILTRFPEVVLGPEPSARGDAPQEKFVITIGPGQDGGPSGGPGGHPSIVCKLSCLVLELAPERLRKLPHP